MTRASVSTFTKQSKTHTHTHYYGGCVRHFEKKIH